MYSLCWAQCSHGTMFTRHNAHGARYTAQCSHCTRHRVHGTMLTQRLNPPSSLQPLSGNSSPHIASYPQHQVFQWELSTWTQLESKRFWHSSFGWVCPLFLSFWTVESTLKLGNPKGNIFCHLYSS